MTYFIISANGNANPFLALFFFCIFILNMLIVLRIVFTDRRNSQKILLWIFALALIPAIGFLFYTMFGSGPNIGKRKKIMRKLLSDKEYRNMLYSQSVFLGQDEFVQNADVSELIKYNLNQNKSICTFLNDVELFTDMRLLYDKMIDDIMNAQESINLEYFIIKKDYVGKRFRDALIEKAKQGVKVRVLYDDVGCFGISRRFFKKLKKCGGCVERFLPSILRIFGRNVNYRNHRKILVVDGVIGYTGGSNISKDYIGENKKISPWRDTHLRLVGRSVDLLNMTFVQDFNFASKKHKIELEPQKKVLTSNILPVQILTDGPDDECDGIEHALTKAIYSAKKRIYLQTPYFVPSCCFMNALKTAARSGVEVILMIPRVPDKKYAYYCTTSYSKELVEAGGKVYLWNGFIHSKTIVIDDMISSVGTVNLDHRSFNLHFELTALIYDEKFAKQMKDIFEQDMQNSIAFNKEYIDKRSILTRFFERIFRLFSPLM